ncbi:MAG: WD40 repeat domain-containing protein [Gemmataceae bacterium]|nr:WD40 repeat domain-containing protein [Gemmataceae bacterium]
MRTRALLVLPALLTVCAGVASAQEPPLPPGDNRPILRVEAGGPTSHVTALAFSEDGKRLHVAGFDKVVRTWSLKDKPTRFELDEGGSFRVPIGPGPRGAINAIALDPDGDWLAVGGAGDVRGGSAFGDLGVIWPAAVAFTPPVRRDLGLIYLFNTRQREVRLLRGHHGPVVALTFAPKRQGKVPLLISAARGWDPNTGKDTGEVLVWDLKAEKPRATLLDLPRQTDRPRPVLAAWHTGDGPNQLRVAIAWGDERTVGGKDRRGLLRLWDLERAGEPPAIADEGRDNSALALLPGSNRLLTGSFDVNVGRLQFWDVTGLKPTPRERLELRPPGAKVYDFPREMALVPSQPGAPPDLAAVVVRRSDQGTLRYSLRLYPLKGSGVAVPRANVPLPGWDGQILTPALAASGDGRHLALGGSPDHRVLVWAVADLLKNKGAQHTLRSVGSEVLGAVFATSKDKDGVRPGLLLNVAENGAAQRLVFDFRAGKLTADTKGWAPALGSAGAWRVTVTPGKVGTTVVVTEAGKETFRRELPADRVVTAQAMLTAHAPLKVPLLVLAVQSRGESFLDVFHAATGQHLRRFTGHVDRVRSLAFSANGKLLVSAAADQTVRVWALPDLAEVIDKRGALPGVVVREGKGGLVVDRIEDVPRKQWQLQPGEVVQGLVDAKKALRVVKLPTSLHAAFWLATPGSQLTLRVVDEKGQVGDRPIRVGQGTDERKPLFTLFVTRPQDKGQREWIGWSPGGFFDSSSPAAERHVGWHENTGKAKEPTTFARIGQYREKFYRKGLLPRLVEKANLAGGLAEAPPPARPRLEVLAGGEPVKVGDDGHRLVRQRRITLDLTVLDHKPTAADTVEWHLRGGAAQPFGDPTSPGRYATTLDLPDKAGEHTLGALVRVRQPDGRMESYPAAVTVRYQPPAPVVQLQDKRLFRVTTKPRFPLKAVVQATWPGQRVQVTLRHHHPVKKLPAEVKEHTLDPGKPLELAWDIQLHDGVNRIELAAENRNALPGFEKHERHLVPVQVELRPEAKEPAPLIVLKSVVPLSAVGMEEQAREVVPGQPLVVNMPRVRLVGAITASGKLVKAELVAGEKAKARQLGGVAPDGRGVTVGELIDLTPGEQTVRVVAQSTRSTEAAQTITLVYHPQARVVVQSPQTDEVFVELGEKDSTTIEVRGRVHMPAGVSVDLTKLRASAVVDGRPVPGAVGVAKDGAFTFAKVPLTPGFQSLWVEVSAPWGQLKPSTQVQVRYARPPQVRAFEEKRIDARPFANLTLVVYSPTRPHLDSVQVRVDGAVRKPAGVKIDPTARAPAGRIWLVHLDEIPLGLRKNRVRVVLDNDEGSSEVFARLPDAPPRLRGEDCLVYLPPLPKKADIVLIHPPPAPPATTEPELEMRFRVRSESPLRRVEVTRWGKPLFAKPLEVPKAQRDARGIYEYEFVTQEILLEPGENPLRVEVVNEGGAEAKTVVVPLTVRPARIELEQLQGQGPGGETVTLQRGSDGPLADKPADRSRVWLTGKVHWGHPRDPQLKERLQVQVSVNGFQQLPVTLDPCKAGGRERAFKAELLLNFKEANQVVVNVPGLPQEESSRGAVTVDCRAPATEQHLHLVLVAPGEKDEQFQKRALAALKARRVAPHLYEARGFKQVTVHALTDYIEPGDVFARLRDVEAGLRRRAHQGAPNDVVVVYYHGAETVEPAGHYLWLSGTRPGPRVRDSALEMAVVVERYFSAFPGAQVVLLDVAHKGTLPHGPLSKGGRPIDPWSHGHSFALLRHGWAGTEGGPGKAWLLEEMEAQWPRAESLSELAGALATRFRKVQGPASLYELYLPPTLRLRLGG